MQREAASEIGEEAEEATNWKEEERAGGEGPDWPDVARGSRQTKAATPSQMEVKQSSAAHEEQQPNSQGAKCDPSGMKRKGTAEGARRMRRGSTIAIRDGGSNSDLLREAED